MINFWHFYSFIPESQKIPDSFKIVICKPPYTMISSFQFPVEMKMKLLKTFRIRIII